MTIHSIRHPKVRKWKALYSGADRDSEYYVTNHYRVTMRGLELGLLAEIVCREDLQPKEKFQETDRTWISAEVAEEIGMIGYWFAVLKKPQLKIEKFERILLLDGFYDAGKLGSMIRSARCFGFDGIILTGGSVDPWSYYVSRSAQGNLLDFPVLSFPFSDAIRMLRERGVSLVTVGKRKAIPLEELPLSSRMAILLSGLGSSTPDLQTVSDTVCDMALDCSEPSLTSHIAAILMHTCRNLRGE